MRYKILVFFKRFLKLPKYLSQLEKFIILGLTGIIFIAAILLVVDQLSSKSSGPKSGGTFIEGQLGEFHSLIPIFKQTDAEKDVSKLIFSSLIKYNSKMEIIPDLAEKWEIAPDGKTYTFHLRDANWQDNQKVTADDVVFTFSLILDEKTKSPLRDTFLAVEVKKIDDKTIGFNLKSPFAPFLSSLLIPILPKHLLDAVAPSEIQNSKFAKNPIGTGPFKLDEIKKDGTRSLIILKANKNYYLKKPYLEKVLFKVYGTKEEIETAFSKKDILGFLTDNENGSPKYKVVLPQYKAVFFNLNSPSLDKNLRQAMALATNKAEILQNGTFGERIDYPILPGFLGYKESEKWDFDLEKAKKTISKSKSPNAQLVLLTKQGEDNETVAQILKKQWEALGLQINIVIETNSHFEQSLIEKDYDLLLVGVNQKSDPDPYPIWHSSQISDSGLNFSSFKNQEVDKLLEGARQTMDPNVRKQKYERFVDIIQSEVPAIFLYQPVYNYKVSSIIKGVGDTQGVTKSGRFWNIENWYIAKK